MEPGQEPEIGVPVQAIYANNTMFFLFLEQIVPELEPKISRCWNRSQKKLDARSWSRSLKFEYRLHNPGGCSIAVNGWGRKIEFQETK